MGDKGQSQRGVLWMNLNPRYMINRLRAEVVLRDMPCDYPGFNSEHDKELINKVKSDIIYELKHIDNQDVFDTIKYVENEAFRSGYAHREAEIRIANGEDPFALKMAGLC